MLDEEEEVILLYDQMEEEGDRATTLNLSIVNGEEIVALWTISLATFIMKLRFKMKSKMHKEKL